MIEKKPQMVLYTPMDKKVIKEWLEREGRTREWLAKHCDVSVKTVGNWLTTDRAIPSKAIVIIKQLMEASSPLAASSNTLSLSFSRQDFDAICDAAIREGKRPNQWVEDTIREIANEDVKKLASQIRASAPHKKTNGKTA